MLEVTKENTRKVPNAASIVKISLIGGVTKNHVEPKDVESYFVHNMQQYLKKTKNFSIAVISVRISLKAAVTYFEKCVLLT